jgi:hypothetical protein
MPSLLNLARLALEIFIYLGTLSIAVLGLVGAIPFSVVATLGVTALSAAGTAWTVGQYGLTFFNFACQILEILTFLYVSVVFGLLNTIVSVATMGAVDLADLASRGIRIVCTILVGILLVGWIVGPFTWFPEQNAFQQTIDLAVCQTYPYVAPILRLANVVIEFYNSIAEPLNILGNLLFEFAQEIFLQFVDLIWRGVLLLVRILIAVPSGTLLDNCTIFVPGTGIPDICPGPGGSPLDSNVCVVEDVVCYLLELVDFFIVEVFERFLRLLFPPVISDSVVNLVIALQESIFAVLDISASVFALSNPLAGNPFAGCSATLPIAFNSPADSARQCFSDRQRCPAQRTICLLFYWFRVVFGSGIQFINTVFGPIIDLLLSDRFGTVGGVGIGGLFVQFLDLIGEILRVITMFDDLVNTAIRLITDPIDAALGLLRGAFDQLTFLLTTNPLQVLRNLPEKLLSTGNVIGDRLGFLFEFIKRVEVFAKAIDAAVGVLRSIVSSIASGGGLFHRRRLMSLDPMGIPLNPPDEWMADIESRIGVYNLSAAVVYPLIEIYNSSMRTDCGVYPDTLQRLGAQMDWLPSLDNLGEEELTQGQIDVMRYMITRGVCAEQDEPVGTPLYHIFTLSPRLPESDICYGILGDEALSHAFTGETTGDWWDDWYKPCAAMYLASFTENGTLIDRPMTYMVEEDNTRRGLSGLIRLASLSDKYSIDTSDLPFMASDAPDAHVFQKTRSSLSVDENQAIDADFVAHITRPRPAHPRQKWIDRHQKAIFSAKNEKKDHPGWGMDWARHKISTHRVAQAPRHTVYRNRQLLQTSAARTWNFTDDVLRPIVDGIRRFFSTLLFLLARLLRGIGLTVYSDAIEGLIEFMRTYELQTALQIFLDLILNTLDTYLNLFNCDYNVVDNPNADWTIGCVARLQFPPVLPTLPDGVENFRIPYGSPCGNLQTCAFTNPVPNTGSFLDDIFGAAVVVATDGPCRSEYQSCSTLGFTDGFDVLIYIIELSSIETGVDVIGFFRSRLFSTLVSITVNFIGITLSPLAMIIDDGGLLADLAATPDLRGLPFFGEIFFRFENNGIFPRSEFHDFCVGWGYGLTFVPGVILLALLIILFLFLIRIIPVTFRVINGVVGIIRPPTYIEQMARDMRYQDALDEGIIVRQEVMRG